MGVVENKLRKLQISQNEILHITSFIYLCFLNSCEVEIYFLWLP